MKIDIVMSTSYINDFYAWKICHKEILENIESKNYIVVVPGNQLKLYKKYTSSTYQCISEEEYFPELTKKKLSLLLDGSKRKYIGWYYQQLLKLASYKNFNINDNLLIVDGDSFPTKAYNYQIDGKFCYLKGEEEHVPYFNTLKNLIGIGKIADYSFIAQIFPSKISWGMDFLNEIESRHGLPWYMGIINSLDPDNVLAMSEYEFLGNYFLLKNYPITTSEDKFLREGGKYLNSIIRKDNFYNNIISEYSLIAIEKIDTQSIYLKIIRKLRRIIYR